MFNLTRSLSQDLPLGGRTVTLSCLVLVLTGVGGLMVGLPRLLTAIGHQWPAFAGLTGACSGFSVMLGALLGVAGGIGLLLQLVDDRFPGTR